mgnify:CR=1 FL=1
MAISQQEVIQKFLNTLDTTKLTGTSALNAAVAAATNSKITGVQALINQFVADCKFCIDTNTDNDAAEFFLENYCGIVLDNDDTGAITGKDAGGSVTKNPKTVVPESGDFSSFSDDSFTTHGVTFQLGTFGKGKNHFTPASYT